MCGAPSSRPKNGKPVTERSGRRFDARHAARPRVFGQASARLVEGIQQRAVKEAAKGEGGVERLGCVALAEDEAVTAGVVRAGRIDAQDAPVQDGQDIDAGQV